MTTQNVKLYAYNYNQLKTYMVAVLFTAGNIILPQLCHLMPQGGLIWLPIYFFTLVAAYKFGWKAGLLTAVLSPVINSVAFGMPAASMLPVILIKSVLLTSAAGYAAYKFKSFSLLTVAAVVATYQVAGSIVEWAISGSLTAALQDISLGLPGILVQIFGGYLFIKYIIGK